jgi:hypothetical protein
MATWSNHVTIAGPRNGTTSHTIDPNGGTVVAGANFTATAGRLLVACADGGVTSTTPSGWTLPTGGSAINQSGLYVWWRSAAGSDTFSSTHNASNYPVVFDIYEFAAGSSFVSSAASTGGSPTGATGPTLSGLTGTNWVAAVAGQANASGEPSSSVAWNNGVEAADTSVVFSATDGYTYSLSYREDYASATAASTATITGNTSNFVERLVFAVNVAGGATPLPPEFVQPPRRAT